MPEQENRESATKLIARIWEKYGVASYIFRGTPKVFSDKERGISSSLYRWAKDKKAINQYYRPSEIEKEIVEKARRYFPDKASNIEILTEIRHYGGKVNFIDFTHNLYIALFFACNGDFDCDGEILFVDTTWFRKVPEINYSFSPPHLAVIEPTKTESSRTRVIAQDSVFIYVSNGYLERNIFQQEKVPQELKKDILNHLRKFNNISQDTIYNDLLGFIQNEDNYETAQGLLYMGHSKVALGDYNGAIKDYDRAVDLDPNNPTIYNNRGVAKSKLGMHKEAIKDYDKSIEIRPDYFESHMNRGADKAKLNMYKESLKDCTEAIRLSPDNAEAYNSRGSAYGESGRYKEAIKDYKKALELAPDNATISQNLQDAEEELKSKETD